MLSITQFEVYVLDQGRWTIHARYGSDQRKAAVMDARTTEFTTGLPTKVVAETYFPEIDEAELVTAYISPKAREMREAAKTKRAGRNAMARVAAMPQGMRRGRANNGSNLKFRQLLLQGLVAAAFSLVAATLTTACVSWALKRVIEVGAPISQDMSSNILTYSYGLFFLLYFMSLFRSRLPLHRLLSYLWAKTPNAAAAEKPVDPKAIAAEIAPRLRPKQPAAVVEAQAARAREELKMMRGDPEQEFLRAEEEYVPPPPPVLEPEPVAAPPVLETASEKKKREKAEQKKKEEAEKATAAAAARAAAAKAAAQAKAAEAKAEKAAPEPLPLERAVLQRFIAEVVRPATAGTMPDDPVTRRGVSLVVAGAAMALGETARTPRTGQLQLVLDALKSLGVNEASAAMFIHQHDELVAVPANVSLVNLGRSALAKHLEGVDVSRILAVALAGWRTPHGQPAGPAPVSDIPVTPFAAMRAAPQDIYLLTELRTGSAFALTPDGLPDSAAEAERDAAMGLHNSVVRNVLGTHSGHEVKHTGTGIFAHFKKAGPALAAAGEIQRRFAAGSGERLAVAVIASTNSEDDPLLNANVVRQAQTAAAQAVDGEILAERRVQRAAGLADPADTDGEDDETALVKIPTESEAEEPALYEHVPTAPRMAAAPTAHTVNAS